MKTFTHSFLITVLVFIAIPSAYAATQLEETIALMQKTSPLPANIQSAVTSFVQTTCGFGAFNGGLTIKNNLKNPFSTWPSDIRTRLQACADANPAVVTSIQNQLLALSSQPSTPPTSCTYPKCLLDSECKTGEVCKGGNNSIYNNTGISCPGTCAQPTATTPPPTQSPGTTPPPSSTQTNGFVPLAPIPGLTDPDALSAAKSSNLASFFNNLYKYLIGLAAILAVIEIIWGGLQISTQDSVSKHGEGRERITQAILGLVLVLCPVLVFSIVNPAILNLSLNLPPLDIKAGTSVGTGGGTGGPGGTGSCPAGQTGTPPNCTATTPCTVTGTLLKTAICPTQKDARDFSTACSTGPGTVPFFTTDHKATCGTDKGSVTGPYSFADTSSGILATIFGYSKYEPIASRPTNSNNGNAVLQFASACTADGGTTCMSTIKLPCLTSVVQIVTSGALPTTSCWNISLFCTDGKTGAGGCDSNPKFTVVQTK